MVLANPLITTVCLIVTILCDSFFETSAVVAEFVMKGDSTDDVIIYLNQQAIAALMTSEASRYQKQLDGESQDSIKRCVQDAKKFEKLTTCFRPVWEKMRKLKDKTKRRKRRMNDDDLLSNDAVANDKTIVGSVADWLSGFVRGIQEPKIIRDGKFVRQMQRSKNTTVPEKERNKNLIDAFLEDTLLHSVIEHKEEVVSKNRFEENVHTNRYSIDEINTSRKMTSISDMPAFFQKYAQNARNFSTSTEILTNLFFMSPRFLPLTEPNPGLKILSPDILSLSDASPDSLLNVPSLLSGMGQEDKKSWMNFIMEIAGVTKKVKDIEASFDQAKSKVNQNTTTDEKGTKENIDDELQKMFDQLHSSVSQIQIDSLTEKGYAFLDHDQLNLVYNNGSKFGPPPFNLSYFKTLDIFDKEAILIDSFLQISNPADSRMKRHLYLHPMAFAPLINGSSINGYTVLSPLIFAPKILSPAILGPLILSPLLFSPLILSPALFSPAVLSPTAFSPFILSPGIFNPAILSPSVFNALILSPMLISGLLLSPVLGGVVILSPLLLFPIVMSPIVLSPFMLSPYLLTPLVLSPTMLSPLILDPHVLSPVILSPSILNPIIMSPGILSPAVGSPSFGSPLVPALRFLSPEALSPNVQSSKHFYWSVASPTVLSRRKRKIWKNLNYKSK